MLFFVSCSILVVTKKEGKERRQKVASISERKVKKEQIYGAKDLNEHGEAVRTFLFAMLVTCMASLLCFCLERMNLSNWSKNHND